MNREAALKKSKETFLMFTRVLIKYLEQKDPQIHAKVKEIIKDCAERNKRREPGYESVTQAMKARLKQVVSESYWQRAEAYLRQLVQQKRQQAAAAAAAAAHGQQSQSLSGASSSASSSQAPPPPPPQQQQQQTRGQAPPPPLRQPPQPRRNALPAQPTTAQMPPRSVSAVRKDISARTAQLKVQQQQQQQQQQQTAKYGSSAPAPQPPAQRPTPAQPYTAAQTAKPKTKRATSKASTTSRKTPVVVDTIMTTTTTTTTTTPVTVIKEYQLFYDALDHATDLRDWTHTPLVLGQKTHAVLTEAQQQLLYGGSAAVPVSAQESDDTVVPDDDDSSTTPSFPRPNWETDNLVGVRTVWSKVRLREKKLHGSASGPSLLPLPIPITVGTTTRTTLPVTAWFNEDVAAADAALAALSEGAQIYVRTLLEKAIYCARQRQNVDGIRLWHAQVMAHEHDQKEPSLVLRLGCDVSRQVARNQANAALVNQRMEEALERQTDLPEHKRKLTAAVLDEAHSMSQVALRPRLAQGVDTAALEAARLSEVAGGKYATEPPLGRVPKRAKLEVVDFQNGMSLALRPGKHWASVVSGAFAF